MLDRLVFIAAICAALTASHVLAQAIAAGDVALDTNNPALASPQVLINGRNVTRAQVRANLPSWMTTLWPYIKDTPLNNLWIPGTHDTLTYDLSKKAIDGSCDTSLASITQIQIKQWAIAQPWDVVTQIAGGARYLDIRPSYDKKKKNIYAQHCLITNNPLTTYFKEIVENWLKPMQKKGGKEVLILHFKDFTGEWDDDNYNLLFNQLADTSSGFIASTGISANSTLEEIVTMEDEGPKVLLVMQTPNNQDAFSLASSAIALNYDTFMWRPWPNVNTVPALLQAGTNNLNARPDDVVMVVEGVITPTGNDVMGNLSPPGFGRTESLLLHWEQGKQNLTNQLLSYMYANWLNEQGAVVMMDNPHQVDAVAVIGANFQQSRRFTPQPFDYGKCASIYKSGKAKCELYWGSCGRGYQPNTMLGPHDSCICTCCVGIKNPRGDCGYATQQYYWY